MIGEVVRAALQVASEVVVVDSGSTDDTVAKAEAAGARVIRHEWLGNGFQKRLGEEACRNDWLLDLDADEIVTAELAAEIRALFAARAPAASIYSLYVAFAPPFGRPWTDFGLGRREKLYDRRIVRQPAHAAFDQFKIPEGAAVGRLRSPLIHHAFTGAEHLMEKLNRNSSTRARELPLKSAPVLALRILFGLPVYFGKRYLVDGFIRGGVYGFAFALMSGFGKWLRDVKMFERAMKARGR
ncbi:MAG: glycosyltransferase family 2 protein [Parvularculaceae bacterium]|jgi:glycosyltransferase involved in cell wall biosynthesis|nr:glycosyltransferase family 2 protein [Parvularculaceae bacterium]